MLRDKPVFIFVFTLFSLLTGQVGMGQRNKIQHPEDSALNIIPRPFLEKRNPGTFQFNQETVLWTAEDSGSNTIRPLMPCLAMVTVFTLHIKHQAVSNYIRLVIDSSKVANAEGYTLLVNPQYIVITGHDGAGLFYGLQSLIQLASAVTNSIPACWIEDHPRFAYRGMHLDVCRHFFSVETIKKWLDILALYKINTFHWHLTDDQGWRMEIKSYPELQTISAYRNETLIGHKKEIPHLSDGKRYGGYYTQDEVKMVIQFATDRHITIIPEIEMPGHAMAALAAYPNLGCTGGPYQTATFWGIFSDVYCAGNDSTFIFLQRVLDEVLAIFPSKYIHIGGDECPKLRWQECVKCRKRMADEHLKNESELQSYFIKRIEKYLNDRGRQIIGWDEILEGGLSPGATVMSWTGEKGGIEAAKMNHDVVMTPEKFVYLDYYQSLYPDEPLAGGGYLPLKKIYEYEPLPPELNASQTKYIIGVQANVWSEYMDSEEKAEYMIFPRLMALAETGWSLKKNKNYNNFLTRLRRQSGLLKKLNIHAAEVFDEITYTVTKDPDGKSRLGMYTTLPESIIRYTTDGRIPGNNDAKYHDLLVIEKPVTIKAAVFKNGQINGRIFEKKFLYHKAVGRSVRLAFQPTENFNPGETSALVNGIEASSLYNDGQWFGFSGVNLEAVVDLGSLQNVKMIGTNFLKYHWQRMWEPVELGFWLSADGVQYTQVYRQQDFPVNGINAVRAELKDTKARYIKVIAVNRGIIPAGEYGAGANALLMVDEILVY
jgi:hexosaminidase